MYSLKNNFWSYVFASILGGLIILFSNKIINDTHVLNELYEKFQPVLNDINIIESKKENDLLLIHVVGKKTKNNCGAPIKIAGFHGNPLIPFDVVDTVKRYNENGETLEKSPYVERPAIKNEIQDFGWWVLKPIPGGPFYLYIDYLCQELNNPYINKTVFGPFNLS